MFNVLSRKSLHDEIDRLRKQNNILANRCDSLAMNNENILKKHEGLLSELAEMVECPVCMEIPRSSPITACKNGHLVCKKCRPQVSVI